MNYQQFTEHNITINNYDTINPLEYIEDCFNRHLIGTESRNVFLRQFIYTQKKLVLGHIMRLWNILIKKICGIIT